MAPARSGARAVARCRRQRLEVERRVVADRDRVTEQPGDHPVRVVQVDADAIETGWWSLVRLPGEARADVLREPGPVRVAEGARAAVGVRLPGELDAVGDAGTGG